MVQNFYQFYDGQKAKDNKKAPGFFFTKGLKCTVVTPVHNADKGQKSLKRAKKSTFTTAIDP